MQQFQNIACCSFKFFRRVKWNIRIGVQIITVSVNLMCLHQITYCTDKSSLDNHHKKYYNRTTNCRIYQHCLINYLYKQDFQLMKQYCAPRNIIPLVMCSVAIIISMQKRHKQTSHNVAIINFE